MEIKIQCSCGTRFAFEVEPADGRMPVSINCPGCGLDGTEAANAFIQQQLDGEAGVAPKAASRIRVATSAKAPAAAAATGPKVCVKHSEPAFEACRVCGKPLCPKCMDLFGYVCSVFCREKAERTGIEVPFYESQKSVVQEKVQAKTRRITLAVAAVALVLLGAWIWYAWFGTKPRVMYSLKIPKGERSVYYQLLGRDRVLSIKRDQMTLLDAGREKEIWAVPIKLDSGDTSRPVRPAPKPKAKPKPAAKDAAAEPKADTATDVQSEADDFLDDYTNPSL